jgi:hypothetical protein
MFHVQAQVETIELASDRLNRNDRSSLCACHYAGGYGMRATQTVSVLRTRYSRG